MNTELRTIIKYKFKKFYSCSVKFFVCGPAHKQIYSLRVSDRSHCELPVLTRYKSSMQRYYVKSIFSLYLQDDTANVFSLLFQNILLSPFLSARFTSRFFRGSKMKFPSLVTPQSLSPYPHFSSLVANLPFPTRYLIIDEIFLPRGSFSFSFFSAQYRL